MRSIVFLSALLWMAPGFASAQSLTLRHKHFLFTIPEKTVNGWTGSAESFSWDGIAMRAPQALRVDGDVLPALPEGVTKTFVAAPSDEAIKKTLQEIVAPKLTRAAGTVTITKTDHGAAFDGVGLPGRAVDFDASAALIREAVRLGVTDVELVMTETQPALTIDPALKDMGIQEVITVGESDFTGSTQNRIHNVKIGLNRFNGHIVPKDTVFSFVEVLGPVDASTGYRKELTILGDKTLPDYGGGLCQVSSTAYRGVWEYGFPIVQRRNHSYTVSYYAPQGTDATIYPPHTDIKFKNDSPGALLIQTYSEGTKAYFIYYGTRDARQTSVVGPFTWARTSPPPPRTEYTDEIPEGTRRKVGDAVPGMQTAWYRFIESGTGSAMETVLSSYQARPLFYQIGGADPALTPETPDWLQMDEEIDPSA